MEKLKLHTPNLTEENIERLAALFPNCVTEAADEKTGQLKRAIDFDQLRQELSDHIVEGPRERSTSTGPASARRCWPPMRRSPRRCGLAARRAWTSIPPRISLSKATTWML